MKKLPIILTTLAVAVVLSVVDAAQDKIRPPLTSFNAGEVSPLMQSRWDYPKYASSAQTLQNMLVRPQGPIQRRPGTKFIAEVKDSTDYARVIPFEYSTEDSYIIELGDLYARFYRNGAQVLDANSVAYEIVTPWDANDLFEVQFVQDSQYMRLVHPDYAPYKLTRTAHAAWTCTAIDFNDGPFIAENEDSSITITPSAETGDINMVSSSALFDDDHVGALWRLTHPVDANTITGQFTSAYLGGSMGSGTDSNSVTLAVAKNQEYTVVTAGYWIGTLFIQKSYDSGTTWRNVYSFISPAGVDNLNYSGTEELDDAIYRLRVEDHIGPIFHQDEYYYSFSYTLSSMGYERQGVVEITDVNSTTVVQATVIYSLGGTSATYKWAEGYWSTYRGFPRTVEFYEQRCIYGGSDSFPQTVWGSITALVDEDYDDFSAGTGEDDDAWTYVLPGKNPIQWLKAKEYLMVGTQAAIGRLGTKEQPLTPSFTEYKIQAKTGCAYIQPAQALDAILFVEYGSQKVREIEYTYTTENFTASDMTVLAEHITGDGIVEIDWMQRPDPILWSIREDGQLLSFTYDPGQEVMAWARHVTGQDVNDWTSWDEFESVAVIPGSSERADGEDRNDDEVWVVVNRTVDSNTVRYVEQFQPMDWGTDPNYCWFVDCGLGGPDSGLSESEPNAGSSGWTGDIDPIAWWTLEDGDLTYDAMDNSNTLTNSGVTWSEVQCPNSWSLPDLGSLAGSGDFDGSSYMSIADASLSTTFPYREAGDVNEAMFFFWFYADSAPASGEQQVLFEKDGAMTVSLYHNPTGSGASLYEIRLHRTFRYPGYLGGGHDTFVTNDNDLPGASIGEWNHFGLFFDADSSLYSQDVFGMLWNDTYGESTIDTFGTEWALNDSPFVLGAQDDDTENFDGRIDDFMVFNYAVDTSNWYTTVRYIRAGPQAWEEPGNPYPYGWTGGTPLIGESVCVYADGMPIGSFIVDANGLLDLDDDYDIVIAGLNYYSIYESMPLTSMTQQGSSAAELAEITRVKISFFDTMGANLGATYAESTELVFSDDDFATAIPPWSGVKVATFPRGSIREPVIYLWVWDPIPMSIRAIYPTLNVFIQE